MRSFTCASTLSAQPASWPNMKSPLDCLRFKAKVPPVIIAHFPSRRPSRTPAQAPAVISKAVKLSMCKASAYASFGPRSRSLTPPTASTVLCYRGATSEFRDDVEFGLSISMHLSQALLVQANMLASRKMAKLMAVVSTLRTVGKRRDNM